jgi:hypothetical protein
LISEGRNRIMLFGKQKTITVTIKLFSGLEKIAGLKEYDPYKGITLQVRENIRLRRVLAQIGVKDLGLHAYFIEGKRVSLWTRLRDGDEISCMRPSAGG